MSNEYKDINSVSVCTSYVVTMYPHTHPHLLFYRIVVKLIHILAPNYKVHIIYSI